MSFWKYEHEWEDGVTDFSIELHCYKLGLAPPVGLGKAGHLVAAIEIAFPETLSNGRRGYVVSEWTRLRARSWCEDLCQPGDADWNVWWGSSSCGKSCDAAVFALVDWLSAPDCTTTMICSTTGKMLEKRVWNDLIKFYNLHPQFPGKHSKTKRAILWGDEIKHGIHGIAIKQGSLEDAMGDLIGVHNSYVRLIIDEGQSTREAAFEATDNLTGGAEKSFKFLAMGNPISKLDPLGRYSEPAKGWNSVDLNTGMWPTVHGGKCIHFHGLKSPGVKDPKRFPMLLTQKQIDRLAKRRGVDSPGYWTFVHGFVAPEGLLNTVMTESFITMFKMMAEPEWEYVIMTLAALDPSYSSGGDRCVLGFGVVGKLLNGPVALAITEIVDIKLKLSGGKPVTYKIQEDVVAHCKRNGVDSHHFGMDITGAQRVLADVIEKEWERGIHRVEFGGAPSDYDTSLEDQTPAKKAYKNRVTELWHTVAEFGRSNQLRGMTHQMAKEFTNRIVLAQAPTQIEPKLLFKARTGASPDESDMLAVMIDMLRARFQIHPGHQADGTEEDQNHDAQHNDPDSWPDNYQTQEV